MSFDEKHLHWLTFISHSDLYDVGIRKYKHKLSKKEEARTKRDSNSLGIVIVVAIGNVIMLVVTRKRIICELYIVHSA